MPPAGHETNGFTVGQEALIERIVFRVGETLLKRMDEKLARHVDTCPVGRRLSRYVWTGIGIGIGLSLAGLSVAGVVQRLLETRH